MTDQYSDNVPADFDAFSAPSSRFPSGYDTYPDPTLSFEAVSPKATAYRGFKARYANIGKAKTALGVLAVVVVAAAGTWAASAAFASPSSPSSSSVSPPLLPAGSPTKAGARGNGDRNANKAARVTITQVDNGTFTGTDARGQTLTVVYGDDTRFGTKARPLSPDQLAVGMTVTVLGPRDGTSIDAVAIGLPANGGLAGGSQPSGSATPGQLSG